MKTHFAARSNVFAVCNVKIGTFARNIDIGIETVFIFETVLICQRNLFETVLIFE